jgi:hypothetical protein
MRIFRLFLFIAISIADQAPLLDRNQNQSISKDLFNDLEELSRLVDIAYCVGLQGPGIQRPFQCPNHCAEFDNFELVTAWHSGLLLSDSCGYIALSHPPARPRLLIAFRGTYSLANTIADLATIPQEYVPYPSDGENEPKCDNCTVHMGFWNSWKNTRDLILPNLTMASSMYPDYQLTLVGHSLGGAIASLAALDLLARGLSPILTTFGEPRLGNQQFVDHLDSRFSLSSSLTDDNSQVRRVTHVSDPVPLLPLEEWGYRPHGGEIYISKSDLPPTQQDVQYCEGQNDPNCSSGSQVSWGHFPWGIPTRYKIWQLLFAHRDYFSRIGLCLPDLLDPAPPGASNDYET